MSIIICFIYLGTHLFSSVQSLTHVRLFETWWTTAHKAFLSITVSRSPLCWWCHPTTSSSAIPFSFSSHLSQHQGLFKWVSSPHQVAKVLEFQIQHQSFQWTSRTDLFRMDWLDLLAVQGTFKSLLSHHSSRASILQDSAFFIVQLSHPYMTTGKTIALIRLAEQ